MSLINTSNDFSNSVEPSDFGKNAVRSLIQDPIPQVRYFLICTDGPDVWTVRRVHLSEQLSMPFVLKLDLVTEDIHTPVDELLGASCEFILERERIAHSRYGMIQRISNVGISGGKFIVSVQIVPAFALLKQRINSRIWQDRTVPQILEELLQKALAPYGRTVQLDALKHSRRTYEVRDYCVQYRESDFQFACRLMQEEGISYYFDHNLEVEKEVLVLVDDNNVLPEISTLDGSPEISFVGDRQDQFFAETIHAFEWKRALCSTSVARREFDWEEPDLKREHKVHHVDERGREREVYDHDLLRVFEADETKRRVLDKLELLQYESRIASGESNVTGFSPGTRFEMLDINPGETDGKYVVTQVTHVGDAPDALILDTAQNEAQLAQYQNFFTCVPFTTSIRPTHTIAKPCIYGPQTAIVVGVVGQEVTTDPFGRVKVAFHWDRESRHDDTASCFIRVAQNWSGAGFGGLVIPRVGMEVVVEFLEGDPDRPLITGCVYNGKNAPPYNPEEDSTKSTFKTESSPGGDGFNELRFEDAQGAEEIFLHAQKNLREVVRNSHSTKVGGDQIISVGGLQDITTHGQKFRSEGFQHSVINGRRELIVNGEDFNHVDQRTTVVFGGSGFENPEITVPNPQELLVVNGGMETQVIGDHFSFVQKDAKQSITGSNSITVEQEYKLTAGESNGSLTIDKLGNIMLGSTQTIRLGIQGGPQIVLSKDSVVIECGGTRIDLTTGALTASTPGTATVQGSLIKLNN